MSNIPGIVINGTALVDSLVGTAGDDTINAFTGQDTVRGMGGDDLITIVNNGEFADVVYGGDGIDTLLAKVQDLPDTASYWMTENMYWVGYDADGVARGMLTAGADYDMAYADLALAQPTLNLRTSNGYPGAWIDNASFENFSQWASQRSDSNDMLLVRGTGTYNAYGGFNGLYADWHLLTEPVIWDNLANDTAQLVAGSTISNVQRLLLKTGTGNDDIRNTHVESNDEIESGAGNDTVDAGRGRDRVGAGAGDDLIRLVVGNEFADTVKGGVGNDTLMVTAVALAADASPWMSKSMYFAGYDAAGVIIDQATAESGTMADADAVMTGVTLKLNTGNSYPGVWIDGVENLSLWANPSDDSNDMLFVLGTGTYNGYAGFDAVYANWASPRNDITWHDLASASEQTVNGSTLSNIERLLVRTGSGDDDIRNTAVITDDEIETGAGNDTVYAGGGRDRVDAGAGDDTVDLLVGTEFADTVHGGSGNDGLSVQATASKSMYLAGYDAQGNFLQTAFTDSTLARVAQVVASALLKLNTGNGYPGVWFDGFENLSLIAHPADDSVDLLTVFGAGTYDGGGGTDTLYADWNTATGAIAWNNLAGATPQSVNGSTISNVERLLLRTGAGNDELSNTAVSTNDEFETGAGNDTVHAGGGQDRVNAGPGNDAVYLVVGTEFADEAHGGEGVDALHVEATGSKSMSLVGYDAQGAFVMSAYTDSSLARVAQTLTGVSFKLNTGNGYPGVSFDGFENLGLIAHPADDSWDLLPVIGAGTYDGGGGTDTLYADWSVAAGAIIWNNLASAAAQSVNGSSISNVERLLLRTGGGADDIRNTVAATNDEFETGAGHDIVYAGGGADRVTPGAGNDTVDGGAGSDTVVFAGNRAQYTLTRNASGTVVNVSSSAEGADRLIAVETLQFADGAVGTSSTGTVDNSAPTLAGATPPAGSTGASTEGAIVLTFSEAVEAGSGSAWLKSSDGTVIEQFDMTTATHLQISGNTLTVSPAADLLSMTGYRLELDAGSLKDAVGNALAALSSYSFTTGPASYTGGSGNDSLVGDSWGNRFLPGAGNDTLNGGAGTDTAVFSGALSDHLIRYNRGLGQASVTDQRADGDGTDTLSSIEKLQFGSQVFDLLNPPRTAPPVFATSRSFLFDAAFYLLDNPELVPTVTLATAFDHYNSTGAAQGKAPTAWFEPDYYANRWPDLTPLNLDAATLFAHYNLYGVWEGRSAGRVFDLYDGNRYLTENPDVAAYVDAYVADFLGSRSNGAIAHYVIYGAAEGRIAYDFNGQPLDMAIVVGGV